MFLYWILEFGSTKYEVLLCEFRKERHNEAHKKLRK